MSGPANPASAAPRLTGPGSTTGGGHTPATTSGGPDPDASSLPPTNIAIYAQTFNLDPNWPTDLVLDWGKGNWQEWDRRLRITVDQRGFRAYLNGTPPCPDASVHTGVHTVATYS
jgi:hypothetical protein